MRPNTGTSDYLKGMNVTTAVDDILGESVLRTYGLVKRNFPEICVPKYYSDAICHATMTLVVREWRSKGRVFYGDHDYVLGPNAIINIHTEVLEVGGETIIRARQTPRSKS
jgi:hypothetical protein